jgi:hypothetical protein
MTDDFILTKDLNLDEGSLTILSFPQECIDSIQTYTEVSRYIIEIKSLFEIYRFNLRCIHNNYNMKYSDLNCRRNTNDDDFSNYTIINAITSNYISSGCTLIESIEKFVKFIFGEESESYKNFKITILNNEFDTNFNYRFLKVLRDYVQHGHIPVSVKDYGESCLCYFDIKCLQDTTHFDFKSIPKKDYSKLYDDLVCRNNLYPHVVFTMMLAEYNLTISKLYSSFYTFINDKVNEVCDVFDLFVLEHPEFIRKSNDKLNNMLSWFDKNEMWHCVDVTNRFIDAFNRYKEQAEKIYNEENDEMDQVHKEIPLVPIE